MLCILYDSSKCFSSTYLARIQFDTSDYQPDKHVRIGERRAHDWIETSKFNQYLTVNRIFSMHSLYLCLGLVEDVGNN